MNFLEEEWKTIRGDFEVSSYGNFRKSNRGVFQFDYSSTNGHLYVLINIQGTLELTLVEEIVARYFIPVPTELKCKPLMVNHIDGDYYNNRIDNLEWVEFIEEWRPIVYPNVRQNRYEISNIGRVKRIMDGKIIKPSTGFGYKCYTLAGEKPSTHCKAFAHSLVATMFVPGKDFEHTIVNHINRQRATSNMLYLEWVDQSMNVTHGIIVGATKAISTEDADMIRDMLLDERYEMSPRKIYDAIDHDKYPNITRHMISVIKCNKQCRRSNKYDLNKIKYEKCRKSGMNSLITNEEAIMVIDALNRYRDYRYRAQIVYDELHDVIPNLTKGVVYGLSQNKTFKDILKPYIDKNNGGDDIE